MKASKKMAKPENWQDFESLCKKLWGEIWKCDEISKNGRQGQKQMGVDVYGIPKGKKEYFGIQCKGKDDYIGGKLTKKEIDEEIERAKNFKPKLKKFYFATTANKNSNIEEYIREKNIENISKGLFEIYLFSWEDIVDLIEENTNTYKYYIESINFKDENEVELFFDNLLQKIDIYCCFSKKTKKYIYKEPLPDIYGCSSNLRELIKKTRLSSPFSGEYKGENKSWGNVNLILKNRGNKQLENYKIYLSFNGNIKYLDEKTGINYLGLKPENRTVFLYNDEKNGTLKPIQNKPLVPKDSYSFNNIDFKPEISGGEIFIDWELVSSHYNTKGKLIINTKIRFIEVDEIIEVDEKDKEKEETNIENFYYKEEENNK